MESPGWVPPARRQRLCRYQIPRTALSCAFTSGDATRRDVIVPFLSFFLFLRSCFLRRSIKFPGQNRIVFSTPCCVYRTRPEALHYHIISRSLVDYRHACMRACVHARCVPCPRSDSESACVSLMYSVPRRLSTSLRALEQDLGRRGLSRDRGTYRAVKQTRLVISRAGRKSAIINITLKSTRNPGISRAFA